MGLPEAVVPFGGAAAIGMTFVLAAELGGTFKAVLLFGGVLTLETADGGDSEPAALLGWVAVGVVAWLCTREFFRPPFLEALVDAPPTGTELPLPRFLFLITSVLSESGLTTP
jgi:hypothetical protein